MNTAATPIDTNAKPTSSSCPKAAYPAATHTCCRAGNYFGGMHLLANPRGDYISCKAEWLLRNAEPDDLIITAESDEFISYLTYFSRSQIVDLIYAVAPADKDRWLTDLRSHKRRVFATAEVFQPLPSMKFRFPEQSAFINELGRDLAPDFVRIASNEFGAVFERAPALDAPRD